MEEQKTFLTEAQVPAQASAVSDAAPQPPPRQVMSHVVELSKKHQAVRNIYQYPSVQNLKCEVGLAKSGDWRFQVPWRFQKGDLGDGPLQGMPHVGIGHRRPAPQGNKNTRQRNLVCHRTASLLGGKAVPRTALEAAAQNQLQQPPPPPPPPQPKPPPPATPHVAAAEAVRSSPKAQQEEKSEPRPVVKRGGRGSSASHQEQLRHHVSVVGSLPRLSRTTGGSTSYASTFTSSQLPPSSVPSRPAVPGKPHVLVPLYPPSSTAPAPVPDEPPVSDAGRDSSSYAAYDNMTSVSQRTPQTQTPASRRHHHHHHHHGGSSVKYAAGIAALEEGLRAETTRKQRVEQELGQLRERQERLFAQLLPHERDELQMKMLQQGLKK
eukprot:Hpha_TRINITY_DN19353_c0_g1::TRINITY_DN19353_c0_g1_i1::g.81127::m.81127